MQIRETSLTFTGKNKLIKNSADRVCRIINRNFPVTSGTKLQVRLNSRPAKFSKLLNKTNQSILELRTCIERDYDTVDQSIQDTPKLIKHYKASNCEELSNLAGLICSINGIKNVKKFLLYGYNYGKGKFTKIEHVVLGINFKLPSKPNTKTTDEFISCKDVVKAQNDAIVIDAWLGFADYSKNAVTRWKNLFMKYLKSDNKFDEIFLMPIYDFKNISAKSIKKLAKENPELKIPNKSNP